MNVSREAVEALHWSQLAHLYRLEHSLDAVRFAVASLVAKSEDRDVVEVLRQLEEDAANLYEKQIEAMKRSNMSSGAISAAESALSAMKKKWAWND